MTAILGLSAFYHDSAAALLVDGKIVAAAQQERFSRRKHDAGFPAEAAAYCLREGGLALADVEAVVFYDKPFLKFERLLETYLAFAPAGFRSFAAAMPVWLREKLLLKSMLRSELRRLGGGAEPPALKFAEHHQSHAASASGRPRRREWDAATSSSSPRRSASPTRSVCSTARSPTTWASR